MELKRLALCEVAALSSYHQRVIYGGHWNPIFRHFYFGNNRIFLNWLDKYNKKSSLLTGIKYNILRNGKDLRGKS